MFLLGIWLPVEKKFEASASIFFSVWNQKQWVLLVGNWFPGKRFETSTASTLLFVEAWKVQVLPVGQKPEASAASTFLPVGSQQAWVLPLQKKSEGFAVSILFFSGTQQTQVLRVGSWRI